MNKMKQGFICLSFLLLLAGCSDKNPADTYGSVKISIRNKVGAADLALNTAYTNPFGETYTLTKYKYYISNIVVGNIDQQEKETESYHLVDAANAASQTFGFTAKTNTYSWIRFTIGVDSVRNVSGAQTGALDPLNDMFWTWNTGYIMAKLEANSPQSNQVSNKVEYHIGGFKGLNNAVKTVQLNFPAGKTLSLGEGRTGEIIIEANINKWWQNGVDLKITDNPVITTPGPLAKEVADNYSGMFTVTNVINN